MTRKVPIRTCIACQATSDKRALVRFVRTANGSVSLDATGKAAGRGAYVCADAACFERARTKRLLGPKLRCKVGEEDYERLSAEFDACIAKVPAPSRG